MFRMTSRLAVSFLVAVFALPAFSGLAVDGAVNYDDSRPNMELCMLAKGWISAVSDPSITGVVTDKQCKKAYPKLFTIVKPTELQCAAFLPYVRDTTELAIIPANVFLGNACFVMYKMDETYLKLDRSRRLSPQTYAPGQEMVSLDAFEFNLMGVDPVMINEMTVSFEVDSNNDGVYNAAGDMYAKDLITNVFLMQSGPLDVELTPKKPITGRNKITFSNFDLFLDTTYNLNGAIVFADVKPIALAAGQEIKIRAHLNRGDVKARNGVTADAVSITGTPFTAETMTIAAPVVELGSVEAVQILFGDYDVFAGSVASDCAGDGCVIDIRDYLIDSRPLMMTRLIAHGGDFVVKNFDLEVNSPDLSVIQAFAVGYNDESGQYHQLSVSPMTADGVIQVRGLDLVIEQENDVLLIVRAAYDNTTTEGAPAKIVSFNVSLAETNFRADNLMTGDSFTAINSVGGPTVTYHGLVLEP